VRGGGGDDVLEPDDNVDRVIGGSGVDTVNYEHDVTGRGVELHRKQVIVDLAAGTATGGFGRDRLSGVENVVSGNGRDVLRGDAGPNVLRGHGGVDVLAGRAGVDELFGGAKPDRCTSPSTGPLAHSC
jgi:Ca2+-binding RTX toxin-like protein